MIPSLWMMSASSEDGFQLPIYYSKNIGILVLPLLPSERCKTCTEQCASSDPRWDFCGGPCAMPRVRTSWSIMPRTWKMTQTPCRCENSNSTVLSPTDTFDILTKDTFKTMLSRCFRSVVYYRLRLSQISWIARVSFIQISSNSKPTNHQFKTHQPYIQQLLIDVPLVKDKSWIKGIQSPDLRKHSWTSADCQLVLNRDGRPSGFGRVQYLGLWWRFPECLGEDKTDFL